MNHQHADGPADAQRADATPSAPLSTAEVGGACRGSVTSQDGRYVRRSVPTPPGFQKRLIAICRKHGWSRADVAAILGCSGVAVLYWERGRSSRLSFKTYQAIVAHMPELLGNSRSPWTPATIAVALGVDPSEVIPLALAALCRERGLL